MKALNQSWVFNLSAVPSKRHLAVRALLMFVLLCFAILFAASFGSANISLADVFNTVVHQLGLSEQSELSALKQQIIIEIRLPRVALAMIAGTGLALAGVVLQTITRNPLADPYLFGISAGAALGAVCGMLLFNESSFAMHLGAFLGSVLSVILIISLAGRIASVQVEHLILTGVAISFLLAACTHLFLYFAEPDAAATIVFWMMGSFAGAEWYGLALPLAVVMACGSVAYLLSHWLNALLSGDESAHTLGVKVTQLRMLMLILSSLVTSVIVAQCGGIGFVGLMVPHMVRRIVGGELRNVLLVTALVGPLFMVVVDVVARTLIPNQEIPIGIITAILGSVFFFMIMKRQG